MNSDNLRSVLRWREDVASGEMIEQVKDGEAYTREYWGTKLISQNELDLICKVANAWWEGQGSPLRVSNHMGEIVPARAK